MIDLDKFKIREPIPILSLAERDRRWDMVRKFLADNDLSALLVAGLDSRERPDQHLTNDHSRGYLVFPLEGEPIYLAWTASRVTSHLQSINAGRPVWIRDVRVGATAHDVAAVLKELGLQQASIGVVGLSGSGGRGESDGWIPYSAWDRLIRELPRADFRDVTLAFFELMSVKSDEDLAMVRRAACVGELATQAMLEVVRPGVSEADVGAAIQWVLYANAAATESAYLILHSGSQNLSWGPPLWLVRPENPRIIEAGDVVQAEIFPGYGHLKAQVQACVAVGPVDRIIQELAGVARESYEAGLEALRPGRTFGEVCDAMAEPIISRGYWHLTPLIHSLNPHFAVGGRGVGLEKAPGIERYRGMKESRITRPTFDSMVIRSGMVFELEPNVCSGGYRINIGGTVVVTDRGVEGTEQPAH